MAIEIAQAYVQIVPSMKNVGKSIESAFGSVSETVGKTEGGKLGGGFSTGFAGKLGVISGVAQSVAGTVIQGFSGLTGEIASASDSAQKFGSTLQFAGVSNKQIQALTKSTQDYADKTVYDLNDIRNTTAQLAANGVPNYDKLAEAAGNLNAVAGGTSETYKSVAMVMTQTAGQGKLTTENWNQLSDAIPGASGKIQQALLEAGAYTGNFRDAMSEGEISAQEFNDAIMKLGFQDAAVQAATSATTIEGSMGNLEASAIKMGATVLDSVKPMVTGAINAVGDGLTAATPVIQAAIQGAVKWLQGLWAKLEDNGAITAFKAAWDTVRDAIMGVVNMVIDWVRMIPPDGVANAIKLVADTLNWFVQHGPALTPIIIGIGTAFAAVKGYQALNNGLTALTKTMDAVTKTATGVSNGILTMMELGGPTQMIGQLAGKMKLAQTAQAAWSAVTKAATAVQGAFNAVMAATGGPIVWIIGLVVAAAAALTWFFTQTETGRQIWSTFVSWLSQAWSGLIGGAKALFNGLGEFFTNLWGTISTTAQAVWNAITSFLSGIWTSTTTTIQTAWNGVSMFFTNLWNGISAAVGTAVNSIRDTVVNVFTVIGALIVAPLQAIQNAINTVFGWILSFITTQMNSTNTVWSTIWTGIYNVVSTIFTLISNYISTVVNAIRTVIVVFLSMLKGDWSGAWNAIKDFFTGIWNGIVSFVTPVIDGLMTFLTNFLNTVKTVWTNVWNAIKSFFQTIWNGIVSFLAPIIDGIRNTITTVVNAVRNVWTNVWNAISSFFQTVWNRMVAFYAPIIQNIRNTISSVLNAIRGTWTSAWNGISSFFSNIWNGMRDAVSNAVNAIGGTVGRIWGIVTGALSGAGSWLYDTGRQIIQGLINGIGGAFGWLRNTIGNLGRSVVSWAKSVLHIGSPSRVFADEVGKWIPAGMAQGVEKNMGQAKKAIDGLEDMVPTVHVGTDYTGPDLTTARSTSSLTAALTPADPLDQLTPDDMRAALRDALAQGVTLHLNDRGGEVMAGKLAKPMSYELAGMASRGR